MLKKFLISIFSIVVLTTLTFILIHLMPGSPFDQERTLPPEIQNNLNEKYGLKPKGNTTTVKWLYDETKHFFQMLSQGEMGPSLKYRDRDVLEIIRPALPTSTLLGGLALIFSFVGGVTLAIAATLSRKFNFMADVFINFFLSLPRFVLAVGLMILLSLELHLLPAALWEKPSSMVLPILTLCLNPIAVIAQMTRANLLGEKQKNYFTTALSKGLNLKKAMIRHGFKNVLHPLLSILGPLTAQMITGSFIVETIFAIPGLGRHFVTAIIDRDYFLVMGITIIYGAILITANLLMDILYRVADPRSKTA